MRKLYIDSDFRCYVDGESNRKLIETDVFDGKCDRYIEGYRLIPQGSRWTRADDVVFDGPAMFPAQEYALLAEAQLEAEHLALATLGAVGADAPADNAAKLRAAMNEAVNRLDDESVHLCKGIVPRWNADGVSYVQGDVLRYQELLYRVLQNHTSQLDWAPDSAQGLFAEIPDPDELWPAWRQPVGSEDAYAVHARVAHDGRRWISECADNIWQPGVYGWQEVEAT